LNKRIWEVVFMPSEEMKTQAPPHRLTLDERRRLTVTGVEEVVSFHEEEVAVRTVKGLLIVRGEGLKVDKLEKSSGELTVSGLVTDLGYETERTAAGFLARLFH
jgi:sporulation protein YabP